MDFKLQSGDTLVEVNEKGDPFNRVKRWALGSPYDHVFLYLGYLRYRTFSEKFPLLFESEGRGVGIKGLSYRYGHRVLVLRLDVENLEDVCRELHRVELLLDEAVRMAADTQAYYDYLCIARNILPRLLYEKLGIPVQLLPPFLQYRYSAAGRQRRRPLGGAATRRLRHQPGAAPDKDRYSL